MRWLAAILLMVLPAAAQDFGTAHWGSISILDSNTLNIGLEVVSLPKQGKAIIPFDLPIGTTRILKLQGTISSQSTCNLNVLTVWSFGDKFVYTHITKVFKGQSVTVPFAYDIPVAVSGPPRLEVHLATFGKCKYGNLIDWEIQGMMQVE